MDKARDDRDEEGECREDDVGHRTESGELRGGRAGGDEDEVPHRRLGAMVVARELRPPQRLRRDAAVSGLPSAPTYGLIATCNKASPLPTTNRAKRKRG